MYCILKYFHHEESAAVAANQVTNWLKIRLLRMLGIVIEMAQSLGIICFKSHSQCLQHMTLGKKEKSST
jgi:hypothetical protein